MTTTITVAERVARGAALLDHEDPGWWQRIDVSGLDLASCQACVLGQLFGEFNDGVEAVFPRRLDKVDKRIGFAASRGFDVIDDVASDSFDALTAAWLDLINERRWSARPGNLALVTASTR